MKKVKGLAKELICVTHRHKQQGGEGQKEGGVESGLRWAKGGGNGDICNSYKYLKNKF